jgi:hypothetical protein
MPSQTPSVSSLQGLAQRRKRSAGSSSTHDHCTSHRHYGVSGAYMCWVHSTASYTCLLTAVSHAKGIQTPHLRACYACSFAHDATTFVPRRNSISMYHVHSCWAFHVSAGSLFLQTSSSLFSVFLRYYGVFHVSEKDTEKEEREFR